MSKRNRISGWSIAQVLIPIGVVFGCYAGVLVSLGVPVIVSVTLFVLPIAIAGGILFKLIHPRVKTSNAPAPDRTRCQRAECPRLDELVTVYRHSFETVLAARAAMEGYAREHN